MVSSLKQDSRLHKMLAANILSAIGTGITMTAIPWLLVNMKHGNILFGYVTIAVTILMFLLAPYVGLLVDRFSRKKLLLFGEGLGFVLVGIFSLYGLIGGTFAPWHLMILFGSSSLYYTLFYPTMFAFNQEIFDRSQYKAISGIMEVQGQLSSVISGGLATIVITRIDLKWILILDCLTYLSAFFILWTIPYLQVRQVEDSQSFWRRLTEGYRYMKQYPVLFLFFIASFMPFIGVMVTNYIFPIYISDILKASGSVYGMQGLVYGIGAALAGLAIPFMLKKIGNELSIILTIILYTTGITLFIFFPYVSAFYIFTVFCAIGNAGTRVARNSFMMEVIPNDKIGRVDSLFRLIGLAIRVILLFTFTKVISATNAITPIVILSVILIVSTITVILTAKTFYKDRLKTTNKGLT